jgi:hypothetical protein
MGWFSTMLGTSGVVDGIREGVDKAILTPEERLDYHKELLKSYEPFKLIQRYLALCVTAMFGLVAFLEIGLVILGAWFPIANDTAIAINGMEVTAMICWSFMAVMTLYFSGGVINSLKK